MPKPRDNNDGKHIVSIISRSKCPKHNAAEGEACYNLVGSSGDILFGVCNRRAVLAGADGKVSETSYVSTKRNLKNKKVA